MTRWLDIAALALLGVAAPFAVSAGTQDTRGGIRVIDGDTIAVGRERIRLNGIDAPEMPGHCRRGRACVQGDPHRARRSLEVGLMQGAGPTRIHRLKRDRYGRTVAQVMRGDVDLSCWQVAHGAAVYVGRWDEANIMDGSCE